MKKIYIAADHAGFALKEKLKRSIKGIEDLGAFMLNKNDDYPVYALRVARKVASMKGLGILICGSGQGMCIAANKIKGARAVLAENKKDALLARREDNANIVCLQGRILKEKEAREIVKVFLKTPFKKLKRYKRRINQIKKIEA